MTELSLSILLGTVLSLVFTFFPVVKDWYEPLEAAKKAQIMAFALLIVGAGVATLSCGGYVQAIVCTKEGVTSFITGTLLNALIAIGPNQGMHQLTKSLKPQNGVG